MMQGYTEARLNELVLGFRGLNMAQPARTYADWLGYLYASVRKAQAVDRSPAAERARVEAFRAKEAAAAAEATIKLRQAVPKLRPFTPEQTDLIHNAALRGDFETVKRLSAEFEALQIAEDAQQAS
jgi:hypothetical protein